MVERQSRVRRSLTILSFLAPSLIGLIAFTFGPMIASFAFSLNRWNVLSPMQPVGFQNYRDLLGDGVWWTSFANTVFYSVLNIPLVIFVAIMLALIVTRKGTRGVTLFKTLFFMPVVVSEVAVAIMWRWILSTNYGFLNGALSAIGLPKIGWLSNGHIAMFTVVLVVVWRWAGYYMVVMVAGLNDIPNELYESAAMAGVGPIRSFVSITLPLLGNIILFVSMLCLIGSFQAFDIIFVMTSGGPGTSTYLTGYDLYLTSFHYLKMGYGSSMAINLFVVLLLLSILQLRINRVMRG